MSSWRRQMWTDVASRAEPAPVLLYSSQVALTDWLCRAPGQPGVVLAVARGGTHHCVFSHFNAPDKQSVLARSQSFLLKTVVPLRMESCGLETSHLRSTAYSLVTHGSSSETFKSSQVMYFETVGCRGAQCRAAAACSQADTPGNGSRGNQKSSLGISIKRCFSHRRQSLQLSSKCFTLTHWALTIQRLSDSALTAVAVTIFWDGFAPIWHPHPPHPQSTAFSSTA